MIDYAVSSTASSGRFVVPLVRRMSASPFPLRAISLALLTSTSLSLVALHAARAADTVYDNQSETISTAVATATATDSFIIGDTGTAAVSVVAPGSMTTQYDFIVGNAAGSSGTVTTNGAVSLTANRFYIGLSGDGTMTVNDGGTIAAVGADRKVYVGNTGGTGILNLSGSSTTLTAEGLRIGWAPSADSHASGEMTISSGATATIDQDIYLGENAYTTGTLTVTGAGSAVSSDRFYVANMGTGTVNVLDGGSATTRLMFLGWTAGSDGTALVSGSGSSLTATSLSVGYGGTGTMTLADGATTTVAGNVNVGEQSTSSGTLTVTGAGTTLTSNVLNVGMAGTGSMTVSNGATTAVTTDVTVGQAANSSGVLTITGAGSSVTSDRLYVAETGAGTLNILDGASYTTTGTNLTYLGWTGGTTGIVNVSGSGSSLSTGALTIGTNGNGTMTVANGATTTVSNNVDIGYNGTSTSTLTVTGAGSELSALYARVGVSGNGALTVSDGGTVTMNGGSGTIQIAVNASATGALNIGAAEGATATSAGTVDAATVAFGSGTGAIVFNHTDADYVFGSAVTGTGTIKSLSGATSLTGDYSGFLGGVTVEGGLLSVDTDSFVQNAFTVDGGTLRVTGAVSGATDTVTVTGGSLVNAGSISGTTNGVVLAGSGGGVTTMGSITGGTASILYSTGGHSLTVLPGASFGSVVDYNNTTGNTTSFGAGSYSVPVARYLSGSNTVQLNNTRQAVVYSDAASSSGSINVVDAGASASMGKSMQAVTSAISRVTSDILSLDVDRTGATFAPSGATLADASADDREGDEVTFTASPGGMAVDQYGNLFWTRAFGGKSFDTYSDTSAYHYGVAVGADHVFGQTRVGVMGGYSKIRNRADGGSSEVRGDTRFGGIYARQAFSGGYNLDASLLGGGISSDARRDVNAGSEVAKGKYDGWFVTPELSLSRAYEISPEWTMTPKGTVRYTRAAFDGYSESGSSMNLSYDDRTAEAVQGAFELKLTTEREALPGRMARLSFSGAVLDTYNMGDSSLNASLQGTDFSVSTMKDRNVVGGRLGVSGEIEVSSQTTLFAGFDTSVYSDESRDYSANAGLYIRF